MNKIYVSRGGEQFGPYSLDEISKFVREGIFAPTDHAWRDGMAEWVALHTMLPPKILSSPAVPPPSSTVPTGTRSSQCCPHCGSHDHYYKVSALYESEISQINSSTTGVGVGVSGAGLGVGVGKSKTAGTIQTNLAYKLAPPTHVKDESGDGCHNTSYVVFIEAIS
ncbi:MAG TPA: DUF4339 domain-containing protein [Bacteroidia bacterium]|nr:DUF4339 domain-containing protein [Bacteroidia bacterium]